MTLGCRYRANLMSCYANGDAAGSLGAGLVFQKSVKNLGQPCIAIDAEFRLRVTRDTEHTAEHDAERQGQEAPAQ